MSETATTTRRAGLLESAMVRLFMRHAQVLEVEDVGTAFRIVTLGGEALRNVAWTPGDKVQIQLGGWVQRTYTPMDWDAKHGRTRILVYLHGDAPGTHWARTLCKGDECAMLGPRKSMDLTSATDSALLFGDETSFGLAYALANAVRPQKEHLFLEVSSLTESQPAIRRLGLNNAYLGVRSESDTQWTELEAKMQSALQALPTAHIVLSGKAGSIQHMRKWLKPLGMGSNRLQNKAYWAPGKTGLD